MKKLVNQCKNLKYLHYVKLKNNSLHQKHGIGHIVKHEIMWVMVEKLVEHCFVLPILIAFQQYLPWTYEQKYKMCYFCFINRHFKTYTIMICTKHMMHILVEGIFELVMILHSSMYMKLSTSAWDLKNCHLITIKKKKNENYLPKMRSLHLCKLVCNTCLRMEMIN